MHYLLTRAARRVVQKQVTIAPTALDACLKAEAVVIATDWKEFREIAWEKVYDQMNKPAFVFDGRLLVDADKLRKIGFTVRSFLSRCLNDLTNYSSGHGHRPR